MRRCRGNFCYFFAGTGKHDEDASVRAQEIAPEVGLPGRHVPGALQTNGNGAH